VSFSTFWDAKGGLQMCVLGRAMNIFGPSLGGNRPLAPPPVDLPLTVCPHVEVSRNLGKWAP